MPVHPCLLPFSPSLPAPGLTQEEIEMPEQFELSDPLEFIRDTARNEAVWAQKLEEIATLQKEIKGLAREQAHRKALLQSAFERCPTPPGLIDIRVYFLREPDQEWLVGLIDGDLVIIRKYRRD